MFLQWWREHKLLCSVVILGLINALLVFSILLLFPPLISLVANFNLLGFFPFAIVGKVPFVYAALSGSLMSTCIEWSLIALAKVIYEAGHGAFKWLNLLFDSKIDSPTNHPTPPPVASKHYQFMLNKLGKEGSQSLPTRLHTPPESPIKGDPPLSQQLTKQKTPLNLSNFL